ncbi:MULTISPECIES: Maf family protein [unclassified Psychrobacter]|uniref:Maf family protein n=1 Tax=unclassified Psychrobacter TaxID=196806 RepID=UPI00071E8AAF|nr:MULTISPECIES: Maf family protein [unclassified Psychrobacter]OLF35907.1 septum formation protein Maf [Psychrobacter sp. Cmf 22.2]
MNIILASGSPRRRKLLTDAKLKLNIMSVDIDETPNDNESPKKYIQRMIAAKANAAIVQLKTNYQNEAFESYQSATSVIILTADTIGVLPDGHTVLVKPTDRAHAYHMWQQMSDSIHQVWTAVQATLVSFAGKEKELDDRPLKVVWQKQIIESTDVTFVPLTQDMMRDYWNSGEPADKAGGYAIQGLAAAWVTRINGSYTNVVGLPLAQTLALIEEATKAQENNHKQI